MIEFSSKPRRVVTTQGYQIDNGYEWTITCTVSGVSSSQLLAALEALKAIKFEVDQAAYDVTALKNTAKEDSTQYSGVRYGVPLRGSIK